MTLIDLQRPTARLGEPCQALADRHFRAVVDAAGVKMISPHGMRHTSATMSLHRVGTPVKTVAERLGHAKPSMTLDVYTHSDEEQQQKAAEGLDAVLAR
jgi:integrase